jgi:predicted RND superfamily exporter protein
MHTYLGLVFVVAATAAAVVLAVRIEISGLEIDDFSVPDGLEHEESPWSDRPEAMPWLVSVERSVPALQSVHAVAELSSLLETTPGIERVISVTTFNDIDATSDSLGSEPLLNALTSSDLEAAESVMDRHRFLERYLASNDGTRWNIWVFASETDQKALYRQVVEFIHEHAVGADLRIDLLGAAPVDFMWTDLVRHEALLLGAISLLAGLVVLTVIARGIGGGLILWSTVLITATWTLALFPLFGELLNGVGLLVPLEAFALATSYGLHLRRFYVVQDASEEVVIKGVRPLILTAASTTALGFLTLLVVRARSIGHLGAFLATSVGFSVLVVFIISPFGRSFVRRSPVVRATRLIGATRLWWLPLLIAVASSAGIISTEWGTSLAQQLRPGSDAADAVSAMTEHYGGDEELIVELDSGSEYGLMTSDGFAAMQRADRRLKSIDEIDVGPDLIDVAAWLNGRLEGVEDEITPADAIQFGESLELAYSVGLDPLLDDLVTRDYRVARFRLRIDTRRISLAEKNRLMFSLRDELNEFADNLSGEIRFRLSGTTYSSYLAHQNIRHDVRDMLFLFVPTAFLLLLALTRSLRNSVIILVPSLLATAAAFGLFGWLRLPLSMNALFVAATLLGVGVDDAVLVVRVFSRYRASMPAKAAMARTLGEAGVAAIQTTVVLCVGLAVLSLSELAHIRQAGVIMLFGLALSTTITLCTVPRVLLWLDRSNR